MSCLRWWLTVGWLTPRGAVNSHTQTGSRLVASRLMILTRWGSARALNSRAVASAWSSDSDGAPSGVQQAASASASLADVVVVVIGVPYIESCRCDHAMMHRHLSM